MLRGVWGWFWWWAGKDDGEVVSPDPAACLSAAFADGSLAAKYRETKLSAAHSPALLAAAYRPARLAAQYADDDVSGEPSHCGCP